MTGRATVVGVNGVGVDGIIRDGSTGIVFVNDALGCIIADGETTTPGTASPKTSDTCVTAVVFGGVGGSAKRAGFGSGMVMDGDTWNGLYSGFGGGSGSGVEVTGISA